MSLGLCCAATTTIIYVSLMAYLIYDYSESKDYPLLTNCTTVFLKQDCTYVGTRYCSYKYSTRCGSLKCEYTTNEDYREPYTDKACLKGNCPYISLYEEYKCSGKKQALNTMTAATAVFVFMACIPFCVLCGAICRNPENFCPRKTQYTMLRDNFILDIDHGRTNFDEYNRIHPISKDMMRGIEEQIFDYIFERGMRCCRCFDNIKNILSELTPGRRNIYYENKKIVSKLSGNEIIRKHFLNHIFGNYDNHVRFSIEKSSSKYKITIYDTDRHDGILARVSVVEYEFSFF